jgi:hypothetical protein
VKKSRWPAQKTVLKPPLIPSIVHSPSFLLQFTSPALLGPASPFPSFSLIPSPFYLPPSPPLPDPGLQRLVTFLWGGGGTHPAPILGCPKNVRHTPFLLLLSPICPSFLQETDADQMDSGSFVPLWTQAVWNCPFCCRHPRPTQLNSYRPTTLNMSRCTALWGGESQTRRQRLGVAQCLRAAEFGW